MFAILPTSSAYIKEDAEYYSDLEIAYESALDWSVELDGETVNVYETYGGKFNKLYAVFA
jgi:hypothetical protein